MHSTNNSRGYVDALMAQEVSPPFLEVRELVMNYSGRRKWAYLTRPFAEGALVIALLIVAATHSPDVMQITTKATAIPSSTWNNSVASITWHGIPANIKARERTERSIALQPIADSIAIPEAMGTQNANSEKIALADATNIPAKAPAKATLFVLSSEINPETAHWAVFASGGYGGAPSGSTNFFASLSGSVGLRYDWNESSSFVLEARRTSFQVSRTAQNSTLHDTTISLDGSSYHNTIGKILTQTIRSTNDVATIDAGYRFEWQPMERWSPFAAILLGANTSGMLCSASFGVQYQLGATYLCDVSARADQFVSRGALPERAFEMEAGIGFVW